MRETLVELLRKIMSKQIELVSLYANCVSRWMGGAARGKGDLTWTWALTWIIVNSCRYLLPTPELADACVGRSLASVTLPAFFLSAF